MVETGLVGLAAYLTLLGALVVVARRGLRAARRAGAGAAAAFVASLASFLLVSLSSNVITQSVLLWYFLALAMAAQATYGTAAGDPLPATPAPGVDVGEGDRGA